MSACIASRRRLKLLVRMKHHRESQHPIRIVLRDLDERRHQLVPHLRVGSVLLLRTVQGDGDDAAVPLDDQGLQGHAREPNRMGLNPFRQQKRRASDYVFVAAAFVVIVLLLLWVAIPR